MRLCVTVQPLGFLHDLLELFGVLVIHIEKFLGSHAEICADIVKRFHGWLRFFVLNVCLPEKRREILLLRFYLGYSDIEIGKMFGRCRMKNRKYKLLPYEVIEKAVAG